MQVILEFVGERDRVKTTAPEPIQVEEEPPEIDGAVDPAEDALPDSDSVQSDDDDAAGESAATETGESNPTATEDDSDPEAKSK